MKKKDERLGRAVRRHGGERRRLDGLDKWGGTTTDRRHARYAVNVRQWAGVERCGGEGDTVGTKWLGV
eukprot:1658057-Amphidinium_carterae.1